MKTAFYHLFANPHFKAIEQRIVPVRQGFSFFAFIFHGMWLLYHRVWFWGFFYLILMAIITTIGVINPLIATQMAVLRFIIMIWVGFEGANLRGKSLIDKNYHLADITVASDPLLAEAKFYEKAL